MEYAESIRDGKKVTSREGRVSRNDRALKEKGELTVTSREGRVSRNCLNEQQKSETYGHVPRGTCE